MSQCVIIDYGMGNVGSIRNILSRIGVEAEVSSDPGKIAGARRLILPGVGAFDTGMEHLYGAGLVEVLQRKVHEERTPTLGICLGMQLLMQRSDEGRHPGLGWIPGRTVRFTPSAEDQLKVPHMGWNSVTPVRTDSLFRDLEEGARFYFVHSYYVVCDATEDVLSWTEYGGRFASAVQRGAIVGTQFHPEKSHRFGMRLLRNFVEMV